MGSDTRTTVPCTSTAADNIPLIGPLVRHSRHEACDDPAVFFNPRDSQVDAFLRRIGIGPLERGVLTERKATDAGLNIAAIEAIASLDSSYHKEMIPPPPPLPKDTDRYLSSEEARRGVQIIDEQPSDGTAVRRSEIRPP